MAADMAGMARVRPLFVVKRDSVTKEVFRWLGINGDAITDAVDYSILDALVITGAVGKVFQLTFRDGSTRSFTFWGSTVADYGRDQIIEAFGTETAVLPPTWTDYGGASDKRASKSEGETPFSWRVIAEIRSQRGSAYGIDPHGYLAFYDIAHARQLQLQYRLAETHAVSGTPASASGERLSRWASWLTVLPSDTEAKARAKCVAQYSISTGANAEQLDAAIRGLLGDAFSETVSNTGSLDSPPTPTYWPGYGSPPSGYDLGGGTFLSARALIGVIASRPVGVSQSDWDRLINVDLRDLLKDALPATAMFSVSESADGFYLDGSPLDDGSL